VQTLRSADEIRDVNTRYHDVAAGSYDHKWGIDFGATGQAQVRGKLKKLIGPSVDAGFGDVLEVGAGTGYFSLNLNAAGLIRSLTCTDISAGMLTTLSENAARLGLDNVTTVQAEADSLPFPDESFDVVLGHAVLHHLPDLDRAFSEFHRVLRPGGRILFAGEPSAIGDRIARVPKRAAQLTAPTWRRILGLPPAPPISAEETDTREKQDAHDQGEHPHAHDHDEHPRAHGHIHHHPQDHLLESQVDVHAFRPDDLEHAATQAGFADVRVRGEELIANWFGWFNRSLESSADPESIPMPWRKYAFHGYLLLQHVDEVGLEPWLPPAVFYNLLLSGRRGQD
jgi:ubiquinone/menaquinone biosynthesis C-methylase UbiE